MKPKPKEMMSAFARFKKSQPEKRLSKQEKIQKRLEKKLKSKLRGSPYVDGVFKNSDTATDMSSTPRLPSRSTGGSPITAGPSSNSRLPFSQERSLSTSAFGKRKRKMSVQSNSDKAIPCGNPQADHVFKWLIFPTDPTEFFTDAWEKKPLYLKRKGSHYDGLFSCDEFSKILEKEHLEFNTNIDVVKYENGKKIVQEYDGRAYGPLVWADYNNGFSVRMLNPQLYSKSVMKLCALLQEYFSSFTGANVYLTPPGSQGFAPHYDDIEAFVLQIEGRKKWKVYAPRNDYETLPRFSSCNFDEKDIGEPVMEVELCPGDLLYFPRGFIHQACTSESHHSLHITISTCMQNTYGDLIKKVLLDTIDCAMENDVRFRESLPRTYLNYEDCYKNLIHEKSQGLIDNLFNSVNIDHGINLMAKEFIHSSLPPCLTDAEKSCSIHGNGERWENGAVRNAVVMKSTTEIRWIRKLSVRLIRVDKAPYLYHTFENSRKYREKEAQYVQLDWSWVPAIEQLIEMHPQYVRVDDLNHPDDDEKLALASLLYDKGLIRSRVPMTPESDNENESDG